MRNFIAEKFLFSANAYQLCSVLLRLQAPKVQKKAQVSKESTELNQLETNVKGQ